MDFVRGLLREAAAHLSAQGVLVLEIGNERAHFEAAFPRLEASGWKPAPARTRCCSSPAKAWSARPPRNDRPAIPDPVQ